MRRRQAVRVRECNLQQHPQPCFHGYCGACGECLTKYDETREQCRDLALKVLDKEHKCPVPTEGEQLRLTT